MTDDHLDELHGGLDCLEAEIQRLTEESHEARYAVLDRRPPPASFRRAVISMLATLQVLEEALPRPQSSRPKPPSNVLPFRRPS